MTTTFFDSKEFNDGLFYPQRTTTRTPPGAIDRKVIVPGAALQLRCHASETAAAIVLLFHGNGETVSDYDGVASQFSQVGVALAVVDYRG